MVQSYAQNGTILNIMMGSSGVSYEQETLGYQARVEADGGEVIDIVAVNNFYKLIAANNLADSLEFWWEPDFGVRKDGNNKIVEIYDTSPNEADITVGDTANSMVWTGNMINGHPIANNAYGNKIFSGYATFFSTGNHNDDASYFVAYYRNVTSTGFFLEQRGASNGLAIVSNGNLGVYDNSGSGYQLSGVSGNTDDPHIIALTVTSLDFNFYLDGVLEDTGALTGSGDGKTNINFGATGTFAKHFCWGVFNRGLSSSKTLILSDYLNTKYLVY